MSDKPSVDDYLQKGIFGQREIKPEERNRFLGTLRERIVVALTKQQVREPGIYKEVEDLMKIHPKAKLYLNGNMSYSYLSDYMKIVNKLGTPFTLVTNKSSQTDIGIILAYDHAIDQEDIFIETTPSINNKSQKENKLSKFIKSLF